MNHIILLFTLSTLLISSSLSYSLPPSYYEVRQLLIKKSKTSKENIYVSTSSLTRDLQKILKSAIKKRITTKILYIDQLSPSNYNYYKLFQHIEIKILNSRSIENYIIFDDKFICLSDHYFIQNRPTLIDYKFHCSEDKKLIDRYIQKFKKDFLTN